MNVRIPDKDIPRAMLLDLASQFGIGPEVAEVLKVKEAAGQFGMRTMKLSRVLQRSRAGRSRNNIAAATGRPPSTISFFGDCIFDKPIPFA